MNAFFGGNGYTVVDRTALRAGADPPRERLGRRRRGPLRPHAARARPAPRRRQAVLRARDDHLEPPALHLPCGPHRHPVEVRAGRRREVHGLRHRPLHRGGAQAALVRRHGVRHRRRPHAPRARADRTCRSRTSTSRSSSTSPRPRRRRAAWTTWPRRSTSRPTLLGLLGFGYRSTLLRPGHPARRRGAPARAHRRTTRPSGSTRTAMVVELKPKRRWRIVDATTGEERPARRRGRAAPRRGDGVLPGGERGLRERRARALSGPGAPHACPRGRAPPCAAAAITSSSFPSSSRFPSCR